MRKNVFSFDMSSLYKTRDRDVERILSGKVPADGGHDDMCLLVSELQGAYPARPVPVETEAAHLAALGSALLQSQEGDLVTRSSSDVSGSSTRTSGLLTKRRKPVLSTLFASLAVKITAVAIGVFAVFGGIAAAGALPDQAQSAVSHAAAAVGLNLPEGSGAPDAPMVPDAVNLPDQANVPTSLPAATTPGTVGVPDHVTLPDQAKVPSSVPVGPTSTVPVGPPSSVPMGRPSSVPVGPPSTVPMGPPTSVPVGPPSSVPMGPPSQH